MDKETSKELDKILKKIDSETHMFVGNGKFPELNLRFNELHYVPILIEEKLIVRESSEKIECGYYYTNLKGKTFDGFVKIYWRKRISFWARITEICALCIGTLLAGVFACESYFYDTKLEHQETINKVLIQDASRLKELEDLYQEKLQRSILYENKLLNIIDSLKNGGENGEKKK